MVKNNRIQDIYQLRLSWNFWRMDTAVHLFTQSGGKLKFREEDQVFIPDKYSSDQISVGSCNGEFTLDEISLSVPKIVKEFLNIKKLGFENIEVNSSFNKSKRNIWLLPSDKILGKTKPFVDYQNDATAKDIKLALREDLDLLNM